MPHPERLLRLLLLTSILAGTAPARADFVAEPKKLPPPQGYVTDLAGIVDEATHRQLELLLTELDQKTTAQVAVLTVPSLGDYDAQQFAVGVYDNWKIGKKGKDNGVLFLIAPNDHKMFINTGYGLEGDLPDARCAAIISVVRPYFQQGRMSEGVAAGTLALAAEIAAASQVQLTGNPERAPTRRAGRRRIPRPLELLLVLFIVFIFFLSTRNRLRGGGGIWGGPGGFYLGGMGGGSGGGGFGGGGFGGFGGGSTGGGGAGGSW